MHSKNIIDACCPKAPALKSAGFPLMNQFRRKNTEINDNKSPGVKRQLYIVVSGW